MGLEDIAREMVRTDRIDFDELFPEYGWQIEATQSGARFLVPVVGRRGGKTWWAAKTLIKRAWENKGDYMIVIPQWSQGDMTWKYAMQLLRQNWSKMVHKIRYDKREIELKNGSYVVWKSADNPDCYDDQTEVLTKRGWVLFENMNEFDEVITRNDNGEYEWKKPKRYIKQYYEGPMFRYKNKKMDLLVTPNHKFLVDNRYGKEVFKEISDPSIMNCRIPHNGVYRPTKSYNIDDDDCAMLGIFLAGGSTYGCCGEDRNNKHKYDVKFCQIPGIKGENGNKGNVREDFKKILLRKGYNPHECKIGLTVINKELHTKYFKLGNKYTKYIPDEYKDLPKEQLEILLEWMMKGDGYTHKGVDYYSTVSKKLADDVQEIAIKMGRTATIRLKHNKGGYLKGRYIWPSNIYEVVIYKNKYSYFKSGKENFVSVENEYSGNIYCLEVENHCFWVRRNDKVCLSGNSLRGYGPAGVIFDEFRYVKEEAWQIMRPSLLDTRAWCIFISTPAGKNNLFYKFWKRGMDDNEKDWWACGHRNPDRGIPTYDNPFLQDSDMDKLKEDMNEQMVDQEIEAMFLDDVGKALRVPGEIIGASEWRTEPDPSKQLCHGR